MTESSTGVGPGQAKSLVPKNPQPHRDYEERRALDLHQLWGLTAWVGSFLQSTVGGQRCEANRARLESGLWG